MSRRLSILLIGLPLSYVLAGVLLLLYWRFPDYGGHAHIPFSGFPGFLVWSPLAPLLVPSLFADGMGKGFVGLIVYLGSWAGFSWLVWRWARGYR